jgi:hypothetical protein
MNQRVIMLFKVMWRLKLVVIRLGLYFRVTMLFKVMWSLQLVVMKLGLSFRDDRVVIRV